MSTRTNRAAIGSALLGLALIFPAAAHAQLKVISYNCYHRPTTPTDWAWTTMLTNVASTSWHESYYGPGAYNTIPRRPAILALTEVGTSLEGEPPSGDYVLQICNTLWSGEGASYARIQIHAGSYEDYAFIYDQSQVTLLEEMTVACGYRPAHRARFRPAGYTSTNSDFYIYNVHLKAYPGEEGTRAGEITAILLQSVPGRAKDLPADANIMFLGDFNFTSWPIEQGYDRLVDPAWALNAVTTDPVAAEIQAQFPGWGLYGSYCPAKFCSYSSGGPWSRIDLIFPTTELTNGAGLDVIPGTIHIHGNKNGSTQTYGAIQSVSDHLGVIADLQLPAKMAAAITLPGSTVLAGANLTVTVENTAPVIVPDGADVLNYSISGTGVVAGTASGVDVALGGGQSHAVALSSTLFGPQSGMVNVTSSSPAVQDGAFAQNVNVTVLAHANGSFDASQNVDSLTIDFGKFAPGAIHDSELYSIFNLVTAPSWTAPLSILGASGTGDTALLTANITPATVPAGAAAPFGARFDTTGQRGAFTATWTIQVSDPNLPGALSGPNLVLTLKGYVAVNGDANVDGRVDDSDFGIVLANWGTGNTFAKGDFDGNGSVDDADFGLLLTNWGYSAD